MDDIRDDLDRMVERALASADDERVDNLSAMDRDQAFRALLAVVERPQPLPGFARRVGEQARHEPLPAWRRPIGAQWARSVTSVVSIGAGLAAAYAALISWQPALVSEMCAWAVTVGVRASLSALQGLAVLSDVSSVVNSVGRALAAVLATREASLALSFSIGVGALAFAALQWMLSSEKESSVW